jgi:hypothetical protein
MNPRQLKSNLNFSHRLSRKILSLNPEKPHRNIIVSDAAQATVPLIVIKGAFIETYRRCYKTATDHSCFTAFMGPARFSRATPAPGNPN